MRCQKSAQSLTLGETASFGESKKQNENEDTATGGTGCPLVPFSDSETATQLRAAVFRFGNHDETVKGAILFLSLKRSITGDSIGKKKHGFRRCERQMNAIAGQ